MCTGRHIERAGTAFRCLAAVGLSGVLLFGAAAPAALAHAEGLTVAPIDSVHQFEIEALEATYEVAVVQVAEAEARVTENQAKVDVLEGQLPDQQRRTDDAVRGLYFAEENKLYYLDIILGARSLDDFINQVEYFDRASRKNLTELNKLKGMLAELHEARIALDAAKAEADTQAEIARNALVALQDERANKQQEAQAASLAQDNSPVILDGADWHMTEGEFVATWAPRIDAYFEGTPMSGTGEIFALMSFRYCVDPRWSPAISNTESSKGRYCIRPHNAWGWGAADSDPYNLASEWDSWESAIETHIRGLANGYGYTISKSAADKYCSTPDSWYANTISEMAKI